MKTLNGNFTDLDIKRFYFEGVIKTKCPKCNKKMDLDFEEAPMTYPEIDVKQEFILYCDHCKKSWLLPVTLENIKVKVKYDDGNLQEYKN